MKTLYHYQHDGVRHLLTPMPSGQHAKYLAWDMGTGKTLVTCEAIKRIKPKRGLIVCPAGRVKYQWAAALMEHGVEGRVHVVESSTELIPLDATHIIVNPQLVITEAMTKQLSAIGALDYCVVDEAQMLKELSSQITQVMLGYNKKTKRPPLVSWAKYRWFLSGTAAPNNRPMELFPIIATQCPETMHPYKSYQRYGLRFCGWQFKEARRTEEFRERTKDFIHYVKLEDVYDQLPDIAVSEVYLDIGHDQYIAHLERTEHLGTIRKELGNLMVPHVVAYIKHRMQDEPDQKLVVFAWTRDVIERLEQEFSGQAVTYYGGMTPKQKDRAVEQFATDKRIRIFIGQIKAAGTGIDGLQIASSRAIVVEPDWVLGDDNQLIGRLRRIGQLWKVHITRLLATNTLHETIHWNRKKKAKHVLYNKKEIHMSLEQALQENTHALRELTAALTQGKGVAAAAPAAAKEPATSTSTASAKPAQTKPASNGKGGKAAAKKLTMDQVRAKAEETIKRLSGGAPVEEEKQKVKYLVAAYGAASLKDLPEADFEAFVADLEALMPGAGEPVQEAQDDPLGGI